MAQGCDIKKSMDGYSSCLDLAIVVLEFKKDLRLLEKVEEYCNLDLVQAEIKFFIIVRHLAYSTKRGTASYKTTPRLLEKLFEDQRRHTYHRFCPN